MLDAVDLPAKSHRATIIWLHGLGADGHDFAPIAKELRKVEAEVGPIKYIAALIYGDNPDQNLLDKYLDTSLADSRHMQLIHLGGG